MLALTPHQLDAIAEARFQQRLSDLLLENMPDSRGVIDTLEGQKTLAEQCAKARSYGMSTELDIVNYTITAWMLGPDFDRHFPAMKEILANPELTASQKATLITQVSSVLLSELHKERR
jgi:hypothetical protein